MNDLRITIPIGYDLIFTVKHRKRENPLFQAFSHKIKAPEHPEPLINIKWNLLKSLVLQSKNDNKNLLKVLLLDLFDAVYSCCMASACELFFEESIYHSECYT